MTTKIITIANQKGGVGKTTTSVTLAHGLVQLGKEVVLVDFDPQGQVAVFLGMKTEDCVFDLLVKPPTSIQAMKNLVRYSGREGLWVIPGSSATNTAQIVLNAENRSIDAIRESISPLLKNGSNLDYIVFDTAPSVGGIQERTVWASDLVIIPTATEYASLDGLSKIGVMISELQKNKGWQGLLLGVLPTFYDEQTRESKNAMETLLEQFGEAVLPPVHRATALRECAAEGLTILERDPDSRSALEYRNLSKQVISLG